MDPNRGRQVIEDLRKALLKQKGKIITIDFEDGKRIVISDINAAARKTDKHIYDSNKIKLTTFAEKWTQ